MYEYYTNKNNEKKVNKTKILTIVRINIIIS